MKSGLDTAADPHLRTKRKFAGRSATAFIDCSRRNLHLQSLCCPQHPKNREWAVDHEQKQNTGFFLAQSKNKL